MSIASTQPTQLAHSNTSFVCFLLLPRHNFRKLDSGIIREVPRVAQAIGSSINYVTIFLYFWATHTYGREKTPKLALVSPLVPFVAIFFLFKLPTFVKWEIFHIVFYPSLTGTVITLCHTRTHAFWSRFEEGIWLSVHADNMDTLQRGNTLGQMREFARWLWITWATWWEWNEWFSGGI